MKEMKYSQAHLKGRPTPKRVSTPDREVADWTACTQMECRLLDVQATPLRQVTGADPKMGSALQPTQHSGWPPASYVSWPFPSAALVHQTVSHAKSNTDEDDLDKLSR